MQVLSVTSEVFPLVKTGGLADVTGALPEALKAHGVTTRTLVPGYPAVMNALANRSEVYVFHELFGGNARLVSGKAKGLDLFVLDAPYLYDRPGNIYLAPNGSDWPDNVARYGALAFVAAEIGRGAVKGYEPEVLHLHDWQSALAAVHTHFGGGPPTLVTVHNIAFQGVFPAQDFGTLRLPPQAFSIEGAEYYGKVSFLKGGLACANAISTVSPTYAREICTPEFGMGLDGLLRARRDVLTGIVNGIDTTVWNPFADKLLAKTFASASIKDRRANKRELEQRFGLTQGEGIIHGVVSRLTGQKGLDLLANLADWLVGTGARLALIGTGDPAIESAFRDAVTRHPGRIGAVFGYDEALSHLVQGGADTILVPSRFEPCGLTQLYGLRYGCIPVVGRTGGLADTVIDANEAALASGFATGVAFSPIDQGNLQAALERTHRLYADQPVWTKMQNVAMSQDVSWTRSAKAYAGLYKSLKHS
jgi:starch synthase